MVTGWGFLQDKYLPKDLMAGTVDYYECVIEVKLGTDGVICIVDVLSVLIPP